MLFKGIIVIIAERRLKKRDMKFRKIISVLASAVMLSSTIGFAAAASYPEPFVSSGTADGAVVYGANAATSDVVAAIDVQSNLQGLVTTGGGDGTTFTGTAWQVATSSDQLELYESIKDVESYITDTELSLLADGEITNEKGTAKYGQYLYFVDTDSSFVKYCVDDDEHVGLFFYIGDSRVIARYVMDFTANFKSDITSASVLEDIEDEDITFLGKTYTITTAQNSSTGVKLTLMSGSEKITVSNDEAITTASGKEISVVVSSATDAQFTIDGETTNKLSEDDTHLLADGTYLGVADITYQSFAGGLMQSTIYVGADKIEWNNGSDMTVNGETINEASVTISETISSGDIEITEISINMTAEDDLYVPVNGKLSEATDLDEPEVLVSQNWDIEFHGLNTYNSEEVKFTPTGSDKKYILTFNNYDGDIIELPLFYSNVTGIFGGQKAGYELIFHANASQTALDGLNKSITKNDYFILNTKEPRSAASDARTFVVQYKDAGKTTDTDAKVTFDILGVENNRQVSLNSSGGFSVKLGGSTFKFSNITSADNGDFEITLLGPDYSLYDPIGNASIIYLRTQHNALITINDSQSNNTVNSDGVNWFVNVSVDDSNRDDDAITLGAMGELFITFGNGSSGSPDSVATVVMGNSSSDLSITDPDDNDVTTYQTIYGSYIKSDDPSGSPATITMTIPESIVEPLVYVTSGDVTVTPGTVGGGGQILVVKDSEVASVSGKNLVVIGGSCINTVAAKILGSDTPMCEADFTAVAGAGAGQYIIKTVASPYNAEKTAMLVAGYDAADTTNAVAKALEGVDSTVGTEQVYPITTA